MHISAIEVGGYRGLDLKVPLAGPLGLLVGPNNAGKSSIIDALRTVLQPHTGRLGQRWIVPTDFSRATSNMPAASTLEISVVFDGIEDAALGRLVSILAPNEGPRAGRLTLNATLGSDNRVRSEFFGGDHGVNEVEWVAREALRFIYLPALRDAADEMRPGQANRLPSLISAYAPIDHNDRKTLVQIMEDANTLLAQVPAIVTSAAAIEKRLGGMTGAGPFSHQSALSFSEAQYERIVGTLQALAGESSPSHLFQNGLGYNNLLYIAVLLAALEADDSAALDVLLIEEPEAHLHPQLQALLMEYLEGLTHDTTQVVATTHSSQFASSARIERVTILTRPSALTSSSARALADAGLNKSESSYLHRFLDVTRSSLLFAHRVILVEGTAEQLLMPAVSRFMGIRLSEHGVAVISVDGVSFTPFMKLFGPNALPYRCAVISDSDPHKGEDELEHPLSATARKLVGMQHSGRKVALATKTLEWDLAHDNFETPTLVVAALSEVRPRLGPAIARNKMGDAEEFADAVLAAVKDLKGLFAQALAAQIDDAPTGTAFAIPKYLSESIEWVISDPAPEVVTDAP